MTGTPDDCKGCGSRVPITEAGVTVYRCVQFSEPVIVGRRTLHGPGNITDARRKCAGKFFHKRPD